jgi:phosphoribosyl-AMP cyclohydrolase
MLGYMNREALAATLRSGLVTFYSRSKQRLWQRANHPATRQAREHRAGLR